MKNKCLEIYVHIPFCARKCDYCDFVSFTCKEETVEAYFLSLKNQIIQKSETAGNIPVVSVFFGGGTPSYPRALLICDTLKLIKERFNLAADAEISIEMNPNSASFDKLKEYKEAGFNRISIGLQSANDNELKTLSRLHTLSEFEDTFDSARKAGFANINIDIMAALPGQSLASYRETLKKVCAYNPEHISAYSLIIEEGTPFFERYSDGKGLPNEDDEREMYYETERYLAEFGYHRYEISNYAKEGFECRHNVGYWRRTDYLGFGIAAASLFDNKRYLTHSNLSAFIEGDFEETCEVLSKEDAMEEFMFLGLRMTNGVSKKEFYENFGVMMEEVYGATLKRLEKQGLLVNGERVMLTKRGLDISNVAMAEFLLD